MCDQCACVMQHVWSVCEVMNVFCVHVGNNVDGYEICVMLALDRYFLSVYCHIILPKPASVIPKIIQKRSPSGQHIEDFREPLCESSVRSNVIGCGRTAILEIVTTVYIGQ